MGFSKKQHLQLNIDALRIVFKLEKEKRQATVGERLLMMRYSGFGGLKFVLNPVEKAIDINHWRKTEHDLFPLTQELHTLLKENSEDDKQYRRYVDSNGIIAKDEKLAAMNFLNALEKLSGYIEQEQKKIVEIKKDLPVLQEVFNGNWSKESRLSELKTELAAVERKIQLSITLEIKQDAPEQVEKQKETPVVSETIVRTKGVHLHRGIL
ncbi:hypothetical protein AM493_04175 [Flavobacterium akiainvivens]|uniref:DNA methylase n=1 Tax=Flavobacterium akiainvivens TaxID=1202724 RepID=A0A0M9VH95_9FLAO|nr:hypothetical protein [Flavobacterium akiainvivens]KOS05316.1 hypothetical protein AM493_04175 [Flavobacterium akiainvivens]SFQ76413.1 hypothetical protein SAMN05444144_12331 [Flavobacterium akiainvivens]